MNLNEQAARSHHTHTIPPRWWNASLESSWNAVKKEALTAWEARTSVQHEDARHAAEQALAFGFGGHHIYRSIRSWTNELIEQLRTDWNGTHEASQPWEHARDEVRQGWEFAALVLRRAPAICL